MNSDGSKVTQDAAGNTIVETKNEKGESLRLEGSSDGKSSSYSDSSGNKIETGVRNADKLGMDIYPNAKLDDSTPPMSADTAESTMHTAQYKTPDLVSKVVQFYKDKLKSRTPKVSDMKSGDDHYGTLTLEEGKKTSVITIMRRATDTETTISMMVNEKKK